MRRGRLSSLLAGLVALGLLASGCDRSGQAASQATETATAAPAPRAAPEPEPTPEPQGPPLPDEWYVDSNRDGVPDFVEVAAGYDPEIDDCAAELDCPGPAGTNALEAARTQNTLLMLDASGSMAGPAGGGQTKMAAARDALERYATATPDFVNLGFLVYGHKGTNQPAGKAESCAGIEVLAGLGEVDYETFPDVLASFEATGYTPIGAALESAGEVFAGQEEASNRVIMVSDGIETCDGDPVAAARDLAEAGIAVTVDVVGFGVPPAEVEQLREVAEVTGGTYTDAPSGADLQRHFRDLYEEQLELNEQQTCVLRQSNAFMDCVVRYSNRVQDVIVEEQQRAGDAVQERAISEILTGVSQAMSSRLESIAGEVEGRLAEIDEALDEVRRRVQEQYGEELSARFTCPARPASAVG